MTCFLLLRTTDSLGPAYTRCVRQMTVQQNQFAIYARKCMTGDKKPSTLADGLLVATISTPLPWAQYEIFRIHQRAIQTPNTVWHLPCIISYCIMQRNLNILTMHLWTEVRSSWYLLNQSISRINRCDYVMILILSVHRSLCVRVCTVRMNVSVCPKLFATEWCFQMKWIDLIHVIAPFIFCVNAFTIKFYASNSPLRTHIHTVPASVYTTRTWANIAIGANVS